MQHWVVKNANSLEFILPLLFLTIVAGVLIFVNVKYRNNTILFFSLWTIMALGMHAQIFPLDMTVAPRWAYTIVIGCVGMVASVVANFDKTIANKYTYALGFLVFFVFFLLSFVRMDAWQNGYILYETDIRKNPNSFDLNNNYGVELYRNGSRNESLKYFEKSIALQPKWTFPWNNAGAVYEYQGDLAKAKK
jgi:tetratricopeptide (TPR) repeat protein